MGEYKVKVLKRYYSSRYNGPLGSPKFERALASPRRVYSNVFYEKTGPTPPRINSPISSKYEPEKGKPSKVKLSIFG